MKRHVAKLVILASVLAYIGFVGCSVFSKPANEGTVYGAPTWFVSSTGCTGVSNFGGATMCFDATSNMAPYIWNGTAFVAQPLTVGALNATTGTFSGAVAAGGTVSGLNLFASPVAIAALPTCAAGLAGTLDAINNMTTACSPINATPVATASAGVTCGVFCDGTRWNVF